MSRPHARDAAARRHDRRLALGLAGAALIAGLAAAAPARADRFQDLDRDGDGSLSRAEFLDGAPEYTGYLFVFSDRNNDGKVTRREFVRAERRRVIDDVVK